MLGAGVSAQASQLETGGCCEETCYVGDLRAGPESLGSLGGEREVSVD